MGKNNQDEWEVEDIVDNTCKDSEASGIYKDKSIYDGGTDRSSKKRKRTKSEILQQRSEASLNISEFNLTEVGKEKIKLNELIKSSLKTTGDANQKNLQSVKKLKKLSVPLSKQQQTKIKRAIVQEKIHDEVSKWDSLIHSNRTADQLVFPLEKPDFQKESLEAVTESFVTKHPVEIAVTELLSKSEHKLETKKPLTEAEEKALSAMSAAEAKKRHDELMKHRALISYREAKARYQNKIKSKRYHRLLKKERLKKAMKEFEELKTEDTEKALEKLQELDKLRIMERMTLKHRNTGKWAKQQKLRAKYNPESRTILKEDLSIGRKLREKVDVPETVTLDRSKPTVNVDNDGLIEGTIGEEGEEDPSELNTISDALLDSYVTSFNEAHEEEDKTQEQKKTKVPPKNKVVSKKMEKSLDFITKTNDLASATPRGITLRDEDLDDDVVGDIMPMSEAFGDEDCIAEFREEKEQAEKKPVGTDLFLPGWGSWGGPSIIQSKRKMRRFFIKFPETKKKNNLSHVIINEDGDSKAAAHQVSTLPFPFTNVRQFESYIRQPVGHTWNPQSSFQNLVAPKVITKAGQIIEPIDNEDLVLNKNQSKTKPIKRTKNKAAINIKAF